MGRVFRSSYFPPKTHVSHRYGRPACFLGDEARRHGVDDFHHKEQEMHIVVWSAMRSGSTEFTKDIAAMLHGTFADEPLNPRLSLYNPSIMQNTSTIVMKFFKGHSRERLHHHCVVVLERPVGNRWCSLMHARKSGDWTGRRRHGCFMKPPQWFAREHRTWFRTAPRPHLYLTFHNVTQHRSASLAAVASFCGWQNGSWLPRFAPNEKPHTPRNGRL